MISPDDVAEGFLQSVPDPLRYGFDESLDPIEVPGIFQRLMPRDSRVLDIGCGNGATAKAVNAGKNNQLTGVEPDPARAEQGRSNGLDIHSAVYDHELAVKLGRFDVVVASDVLEHLANPAAMLRDVSNCSLRAGGLLLLSVPNVAHWSIRAKLALGRFEYEESGLMDATHLRWFTQDTLRRLVTSAGFEIEWVGASAGAWLPIYHRLPLKALPGRLRRPLIAQLANGWPRLFACQHLVVARKPCASQ